MVKLIHEQEKNIHSKLKRADEIMNIGHPVHHGSNRLLLLAKVFDSDS